MVLRSATSRRERMTAFCAMKAGRESLPATLSIREAHCHSAESSPMWSQTLFM